MFHFILQTHIVVVNIFLIIYLVKTLLLLLNKSNSLQNFTKKVKILEMIVSVLFLLTGIYLWVNSGVTGTWLYVKVLAILLAIPLAVVGFKKGNKILALLSILLIIYAYGVAETKSPVFKKPFPKDNSTYIAAPGASVTVSDAGSIYKLNCVSCHGADGKLGLSGAADLSTSALDAASRVMIISKGKGAMTGFEGKLTNDEIQAVSAYVETLHQK